MKQRRQAQTATEARRDVLGRQGVLLEDDVEHTVGERHGSKRVPVPVVGGARERQLGEAQLLHVAKALEEWVVDDVDLARKDLDRPVNGIPDLHSRNTSMGAAG